MNIPSNLNLTAGDPIYLDLGDEILVGFCVNAVEAEFLNRGEVPSGEGIRYTGWDLVEGVRVSSDPIHYYPDCEAAGGKAHLSWSLEDTTCKCCLRKRAFLIRGWRWSHPILQDEVAYLRSILGEEADEIGSEPADDMPPRHSVY